MPLQNIFLNYLSTVEYRRWRLFGSHNRQIFRILFDYHTNLLCRVLGAYQRCEIGVKQWLFKNQGRYHECLDHTPGRL